MNKGTQDTGGGMASEEQAKTGAHLAIPPYRTHFRSSMADLQKRADSYKFEA